MDQARRLLEAPGCRDEPLAGGRHERDRVAPGRLVARPPRRDAQLTGELEEFARASGERRGRGLRRQAVRAGVAGGGRGLRLPPGARTPPTTTSPSAWRPTPTRAACAWSPPTRRWRSACAVTAPRWRAPGPSGGGSTRRLDAPRATQPRRPRRSAARARPASSMAARAAGLGRVDQQEAAAARAHQHHPERARSLGQLAQLLHLARSPRPALASA